VKANNDVRTTRISQVQTTGQATQTGGAEALGKAAAQAFAGGANQAAVHPEYAQLLAGLNSGAVRVASDADLKAQSTNLFAAFKASTVDEVKGKAATYPSFAQGYAGLTNAQLGVHRPDVAMLDKFSGVNQLFENVVMNSISHFSATGYVNVDDKAKLAVPQHVGYVADELSRSLGLPMDKARAVVASHFDGVLAGAKWEDSKGKLQNDLAALAPNGKGEAVKAFIADANNGWMFGEYGWGKADTALNMPGRYAYDATKTMATMLGGSEAEGAKLLSSLFGDRTDRLALLTEDHGKLSSLAEFAARAGQAGWLVSKRANGIVQAHHADPKKAEKGVATFNHKLIMDFDTLAKTHMPEIAKDLVQQQTTHLNLLKALEQVKLAHANQAG
jgi:hypothetical protein